MRARLISPPACLPLELDAAKEHLRIFHDDQDLLIDGLIQAATGYLDARHGVLGRALITQIWELELDEYPSGPIALPFPPAREILEITHRGGGGARIALNPSAYELRADDNEGLIVSLTGGWPQGGRQVRIRWKCGYGDSPDDIPPALRQAMLLMIGRFYAEPEDMAGAPMQAFDSLIAPWRLQTWA